MLRAKRRSVVAVKRGKPECFKWPCVHHFSHQRSDLMTRKIFRRGIRGSSIFLGRCCRICSFPTVIPIATRTMTLRRLLSNEIVSTDLVGTAMRTAAAAAAAKEWAPGVHCAAKAAESRPRSFPIQSQMNFDIQPTLFKRETRGISSSSSFIYFKGFTLFQKLVFCPEIQLLWKWPIWGQLRLLRMSFEHKIVFGQKDLFWNSVNSKGL